MKDLFENILECLKNACIEVYGDRLMSLCVFGSVAAGTMRPDSDIDLLVVSHRLPRGRMARVREFEAVDSLCEAALEEASSQGATTTFSPHLKTPREVRQGSPIFLDMTHTGKILFDRRNFLRDYLKELQERLTSLGAQRKRLGGGYYWILKPDLKPNEVIFL